MPIGDYLRCLYRNPAPRLLLTLFGIEDIHTHYRVKSVVSFIVNRFTGERPLDILEVGSGGGINLFELAKRLNIHSEGYDLDAEHVRVASDISAKAFGNRIPFHIADARTLAPANAWDIVLFVDILEHVPSPELIVAAMDRCLRPGGVMVVSVPTPRYPKVFGREMHERIGHLLDGYTGETLTQLFPPAYKLIEQRFTTGPWGSLLCAIQCRLLAKIGSHQLRWLLAAPMIFLSGLDLVRPQSLCATLFAVYRKPGGEATGGSRIPLRLS